MGGHPHIIPYPNVSDSIFVKVNENTLKKEKNFIQISVRKLNNDLILLVCLGGFSGFKDENNRVCIGDVSLIYYTPRHIKPMSNINNITCGCKACISAILIQSDLNELRLRQLEHLKSFISMPHQPGFYKHQKTIIMNTRIKNFQTIHTFISESHILSHHIILSNK